jgi:hypothetical protein
MSETEQAAAAVAEQEQAAVEVEEPVAAEALPEDDPALEPDPVVPVALEPVTGRQAKVYLCDRGHRTVAVWSEPSACHARPTRSGGECGRPLYPIGELPDQVQKARNPLKASKKASKKG